MRSTRLGPLAATVAAVLASGCDSARPIEQRSAVIACARCHGFPPPPGVRANSAESHPQNTACEVCHSRTVVSGDQLVPGGAHMNGQVDFAPHTMPYLAQHRAAALQGVTACTVCHGATYDGGIGPSCNACHTASVFANWQTNCTFCHGTRTAGWTPAQLALAAPPNAANPENDAVPDYRGIGAHRAHVQADTFANPFACTECHAQPTTLTHFDGVAPVLGGPLATRDGSAATWDETETTCANYCHGATLPFAAQRALPVWAPASAVACGACHEANPSTGVHPAVSTGHASFACLVCHGGTHTATAADRTRHVNGTIETNDIAGFDPATNSCAAACHAGTRNWPPPPAP